MSSLLFFFAKLLHAKLKHASCEIKNKTDFKRKGGLQAVERWSVSYGVYDSLSDHPYGIFFFLLFLTFLSLFCHPIVIKINN